MECLFNWLGRGQNSWISQQGCLQFSFKMNHGEASSLVFIQYLFGLSVAKGIKALEGCEELPVKLKWPNDIYLVTPEGPRKIGGILITSEFMDGFFDLIVGKQFIYKLVKKTRKTNSFLPSKKKRMWIECHKLKTDSLSTRFPQRYDFT